MTNNKHLIIVILFQVLILIISVKLYTCEKVNREQFSEDSSDL